MVTGLAGKVLEERIPHALKHPTNDICSMLLERSSYLKLDGLIDISERLQQICIICSEFRSHLRIKENFNLQLID